MTATKYWADRFNDQVEKFPDDPVKALNFSNPKLMNQVHEEVLSCIDFSKIGPAGRLLDTGCGTGELLCKLMGSWDNPATMACHATDISFGMLQRAQKRVGATFKTDRQLCCFSLMSVATMGFADNCFDLILACESLQYTDPYFAIQDLVRMAKPGGQVIISIPNQASPFIQKAKQRHQGLFNGLDFEKALGLIGPQVSSFCAKPLIFARDQDKRPYLAKDTAVQLDARDIHQANRFVIGLVK